MKAITLLTSNKLEGYTHDDHCLVRELENLGHHVCSKPWETLLDEGEDLFVIRTTWNYTEHFQEFVDTLEKVKERLLNPLPLVKWNANKKYLIELLDQNLKVIPLCLANDKKSLNESMDYLGGNEFIAKPLLGASAKGLFRFTRSQLPNLENEMIIQKFYSEISKGEVSLIFFSGQFSYAIKKVPKTGDIRVQEEHGGTITPYSPSPDELELSKNVVAKIPYKWLYARVDIIPNQGLIELECIEPSLYFKKSDGGALVFAKEISKHL